MDYRSAILDGRLPLPSRPAFVAGIGEHYTELAEDMFTAMWYAYLHNGSKNPTTNKNSSVVNLPFWSDKFDNTNVFNIVLQSLANAGWIHSISVPSRNWAEAGLVEDKLLQYVTVDELQSVRAYRKFQCYILEDKPSTKQSSTRVNGKTKDTGLRRPGFLATGNTRFSYDTDYMLQYEDVIKANLTKSMDKIAEEWPNMRHDSASYDIISCTIFDYLVSSNEIYTRGNCYIDSRGRAISSCLSKVANPLGFKDFRALIVIPEQ